MKFDKTVLFGSVSDEWLEILDNPMLDDVLKGIEPDYKMLTPPQDKIFEFARYTQFDNIKVVIIGQDPYPLAGHAHGLAFSCLVTVPASLKNIYKCLIRHKLINKMPTSGDLSYWAEQGVLLLNASLTNCVNEKNAHAAIWENYTDDLIQTISDKYAERDSPLIFMLWGNFAKKKKQFINEKSIVMEWSHPSPMGQISQSFIDCPHFVEADKLLKKNKIDWHQSPPLSEIETGFNFDTSVRKTVVFTDGSAYPNKSVPESVAGYGAVFALGVFKDTILYGNIANRPNYATNQRAEGFAMIHTLKYLNEHAAEWDECIIVSDSDFWIKMLTVYMPGWNRDGTEFGSKKNPDMTVPMWELFQEITNEHSKEIEFRHVKSHNKDGWGSEPENSYKYFCYYNNKYVDELASYARVSLKPGESIVGKVEYE